MSDRRALVGGAVRRWGAAGPQAVNGTTAGMVYKALQARPTFLPPAFSRI